MIVGFSKYSSDIFCCQEKVGRIKTTYAHLVKKNAIYRQGAIHKCGCGYLAVTLRDLDQHRRSGFTMYDGRSAFSCNRKIWCCYCNDGVPHTVLKFTKHMKVVHNVKSRLSFPVMNQCPFCTFSWHNNAKTSSHIKVCRSLFKPELNLHTPPGIFDLPLLPTVRTDQPRSGWHRPVSVTRVTGNVRCAVSNAANRAAAPSVVFAPWQSRHPVSATVAPSVTIAVAPAFHATGFPATGANVPIWRPGSSAPTFLPRMPIPMMSNTFTSFLPNVTSSYSAVHWQNRDLLGPAAVASGYALNFLRHAVGNQTSVDRQVSEAVSQVLGAAAATNNMPHSTGHAVMTASASTSISALPVRSFGGALSSSVSVASHCHTESLTTSSSSKKASDRSPAVVLHRLSVSACEVCGSMFDEPALLCRHLSAAHGILVSVKDCRLNNPNKPEHCVCCSLRFFSKKGLVRHMQIVHELPAGRSCLRCCETGIADIIEHFRVKHGVTLRTMVDYRVCYICKLNFSTARDIEDHVLSAHADIFPSRSHFRQALRASFRPTEKNPPVIVLKNSTASLTDPQPGETRKRRHSVIEIAEDSSNHVSVNTTDEEHRQQSSAVIDLTSDAASPGKEPVKKKARASGFRTSCSAPDVNAAQSMARSQAREECSSESDVEKGPVHGTASHTPRNKQAVSSPPSKKGTGSGDNAANKPSATQDVSVRLVPLKSVSDVGSSVVPLTKERSDTFVNTPSKPDVLSEASVPVSPVSSLDIKETSAEKDKGRKKKTRINGSTPDVNAAQSKARTKAHEEDSETKVEKGPGSVLGSVSHKRKSERAVSLPLSKKRRTSSDDDARKPSDVQNVSFRLEPMKSARSLVVPQTKGSMETQSKPPGLPEVSVHIPSVCTLYTKDNTSVDKDEGRYRFAS